MYVLESVVIMFKKVSSFKVGISVKKKQILHRAIYRSLEHFSNE